MPRNNLPINHEVLRRAAERVGAKIDLASKIDSPAPKDDIPRYDIRHIADIASLIVDVSSVDEDKRDEYFVSEVEAMVKAFHTLDPATRKPYPEAIKPYILKLYTTAVTSTDIDWDNELAVEALLATMKATQSLSTIANDFLDETYSLFPSIEDVERLNAATAKVWSVYLEVRVAMDRDPEIQEAAARARLGNMDEFDTIENDISVDVGNAIFASQLRGSDTVTFAPEENELMTKFFLSESFTVSNNHETETYNSAGYAKDFMEAIAYSYSKTAMEQMLFSLVTRFDDDLFYQYRNLFIDGKPMNKIIADIEKNEGVSPAMAQILAGQRLRDALTDGKSVVSLMHTVVAKDGTTEFKHQDIKVDLDKLNAIDKEHGNYSGWRRFLDWIGISKIQRYPTNASRDAMQAITKATDEFGDALRRAEDEIIEIYNGEVAQSASDNILTVVPRMIRKDEKEGRDLGNSQIDDVRVNIPGNEIEKTIALPIEPKVDNTDKTLSNENRIIK